MRSNPLFLILLRFSCHCFSPLQLPHDRWMTNWKSMHVVSDWLLPMWRFQPRFCVCFLFLPYHLALATLINTGSGLEPTVLAACGPVAGSRRQRMARTHSSSCCSLCSVFRHTHTSRHLVRGIRAVCLWPQTVHRPVLHALISTRTADTHFTDWICLGFDWEVNGETYCSPLIETILFIISVLRNI
jgi:hypothetical protein